MLMFHTNRDTLDIHASSRKGNCSWRRTATLQHSGRQRSIGPSANGEIFKLKAFNLPSSFGQGGGDQFLVGLQFGGSFFTGGCQTDGAC